MDVPPTLAELAHTKAPLSANVEGGSFAALLRDKSGDGTVKRPQDDLVFHLPRYDHGNFGPATALISDHLELIHVYENGARQLYDLAADAAEKHDLVQKQPEKVAELDARLTAHLKDLNAQLATKNPNCHPLKAAGGNAGGASNAQLPARPDFFIDLGDTFMTDKRNDYHDALPQYLAQRYYLGLIGSAAPVFLVLGNHDGEQPLRRRDGEAMALWSVTQRKKFFRTRS